MMYRSMADLLAENANLQAVQQELTTLKLAFAALRVDPVTLAPQGSNLWTQFQKLRPLADACDLGVAFAHAIVRRDQSSIDDLYRYAMDKDSDASRALADAAEWMGTWLGESLQASVSQRRAAHYIAEAAKQVKP
jgi:hypothetical protein